MRVLFVCTGNSCRSPLAERLARKLFPQHRFESAGVMPARGLHELAGRVLDERGADAAAFRPRNVFDLDLQNYDHVVVIGRTAQMLLGAEKPNAKASRPRMHFWDVADPIEAAGSEEERLAAYREAAGHLERLIAQLVAHL